LITTLQLIERDPWKWDVARLEIEFNVGRATVERDIRILRQWGTIKRRSGYFAVKELKFLPSTFSSSEALALVLAGSVAAERIGVPPTDALGSALRKIDSMLPEQIAATIKKMRKRVSVGVNLVRECNSETIDNVSRAISGHNPIEIAYFVAARNEMTRRVVDPYGLTFRFGGWYVIGYCRLREDVRTFGVDRIRRLRVLNEHFRYPKDFDIESYLQRGWSLQADANQEKVILHFSREIAPWISACKFHPHQNIIPQPDGSALFEVTVAGVEEIKHWVLGFGEKVEVISPQSLRLSIAESAEKMSRLYRSREVHPPFQQLTIGSVPELSAVVHESKSPYSCDEDN
jgi:predicted DNA-binding transcriptional regulator YafY